MASTAPTSQRITRDDIEAKLREAVDSTRQEVASAKTTLIVVGTVVLLVVTGLAFFLGGRRGRKQTTVVEIRRV